MTVRARYAPSTSGELQLGNVRTAIFNWLFARHEGGAFILRVEDTDAEKAKPELLDGIYETLRWVGLDWDEGPDIGGPHAPYKQSERRAVHDTVVSRLVQGEHVYRCWCTRDDIKARGTSTGYDRYCRTRADEPDGPYALRFHVPDGDVVVDDFILGEVRTPSTEMQDFVVARSDGSPTFVVANAADDIEMGITHAIRGADLLPAAGQAILIYAALDEPPPVYAHLPLVLGPDRKRLGSRHGALGTLRYREHGYLSEALLNYLSLLGWSSPAQQELLTKERLIAEFTLDRVLDSPAVFDVRKLEWMNQEYLKTLSVDDFEARVLELAPDTPRDTLRRALDLELVQTRVKTLAEVPDAIAYLHERPATDPSARDKWLGSEDADRTLTEVADALEALEPFEPEAIQTCVQAKIADLGLHKRKGPKPVFVAVSGGEVALPLFQSMYILGRDETVARLRAAIGTRPD